MDGWMDERMDGRMDGWMMDGWKDGWMNNQLIASDGNGNLEIPGDKRNEIKEIQ